MITDLSKTVYPTVGVNNLDPLGGGTCSYTYADHAGTPVVVSAKCSITKKDLDTGTGTN